MKFIHIDEIRPYIEYLMGWEDGESITFSLTTLKTFVKGKDHEFDDYLTNYLNRNSHWFIKDTEQKRFDY